MSKLIVSPLRSSLLRDPRQHKRRTFSLVGDRIVGETVGYAKFYEVWGLGPCRHLTLDAQTRAAVQVRCPDCVPSSQGPADSLAALYGPPEDPIDSMAESINGITAALMGVPISEGLSKQLGATEPNAYCTAEQAKAYADGTPVIGFGTVLVASDVVSISSAPTPEGPWEKVTITGTFDGVNWIGSNSGQVQSKKKSEDGE